MYSVSCSGNLRGERLIFAGGEIQLDDGFVSLALQRLEAPAESTPQELQHLRLIFVVALRFRRLTLQRVHLAAHFFQDVEDARQILFRALQLRFGQPFARFEFADARGLFNHATAIRGLVAENLPDAALFDDGVTFRTEAGAEEQILDIAQAGDFAIDEIFALAAAEEPAGDGDVLGPGGPVGVPVGVSVGVSVEGKFDVHGGVRQGHGDGGHAQRLAIPRTGEDDVFHAGATEQPGRLLTQHPTDGIAEVAFSTTVGAHNGGDAGAVEAHFGLVKERLEALNFDALESQQRSAPPSQCRRPDLLSGRKAMTTSLGGMRTS